MDKYRYLSHLDKPFNISSMTKKTSTPKARESQYQRLCRSLATIGYISQGSVIDRSTLRPPRSGYQWTRKLAQKTITVALSRQQFQAFRKAIENRRALN
jgi:hypothetical protein